MLSLPGHLSPQALNKAGSVLTSALIFLATVLLGKFRIKIIDKNVLDTYYIRCPLIYIPSPGSYNKSLTIILIMTIIFIIEMSQLKTLNSLNKGKQMIKLKYNECSQLRVRLAILESQLKNANNKIKQLKKINKYEGSWANPSQIK